MFLSDFYSWPLADWIHRLGCESDPNVKREKRGPAEDVIVARNDHLSHVLEEIGELSDE
jgi:hypothetical protein